MSCLIVSPHSEVSSCNYVARSRGVTKGVWMGRAKELCPDLVILPYESDRIREVGIEIAGERKDLAEGGFDRVGSNALDRNWELRRTVLRPLRVSGRGIVYEQAGVDQVVFVVCLAL